jgi:hypothetical protein
VECSDPRIFRQAIFLLGKISRHSVRPAKDALIRATRDRRPEVRAAARRILQGLSQQQFEENVAKHAYRRTSVPKTKKAYFMS